MNIAVFAAGEVGLQVVRHFAVQGYGLSALALKHNDPFAADIRTLVDCKLILQDYELYNDDVLEMLQCLKLDLIFLGWWPLIIKEPLLSVPRLGYMNMHPSFLPYNRGKHYYFWNLVEDVPFGVTLHLIDKDIDSGQICFKKEIDTSWEDTGASLRQRAMRTIVQLFKDNFHKIVSGDFPTEFIDPSRGSFHWGRDLENASRIDLDKKYSGRELLNIIRGRSGFPRGGAWFIDNGEYFETTVSIKRKEDGYNSYGWTLDHGSGK